MEKGVLESYGKRISRRLSWKSEKSAERGSVAARVGKDVRGAFPRPKSSFITLEQTMRSVFVLAVGWRPFYRLATIDRRWHYDIHAIRAIFLSKPKLDQYQSNLIALLNLLSQ